MSDNKPDKNSETDETKSSASTDASPSYSVPPNAGPSGQATESLATRAYKKTGGIGSSPGFKFVLIGFLSFCLLIPALMVWGLVEERSRTASQVARDIAKGWGREQIVNGPYLVVELAEQKETPNRNSVKRRKVIISPEKLDIAGDVNVRELKKSVYRTQVYHSKTRLSGAFRDLEQVLPDFRKGQTKIEKAYVVISLSDSVGFRSDVKLLINKSKEQDFNIGLRGVEDKTMAPKFSHVKPIRAGLHSIVSTVNAENGFDFEVNLDFNGSQKLAFLPSGKTTKMKIVSNWPHPGFDGQFLPEKRKLDEKGFEAEWTVPNLARGMEPFSYGNVMPGASTLLQVSFVEPLKFYQVTARTLKYAIAFFSLVFLAIFILEMTGKNPVHWIQYTLAGLAMVIFYVLLLALAEQVGFTAAYAISASATTALIAWYVGDALGSRKGTGVMAAILGTTYLVMYLILNEEEYALLAGSIIAFAAIAVTMAATRKVNWSGHGREMQATSTAA